MMFQVEHQGHTKVLGQHGDQNDGQSQATYSVQGGHIGKVNMN